MSEYMSSIGTMYSVAFKYASALLRVKLFAKNEVFVVDPEKLGRIFRAFMGARFVFGIVVMLDDPVLDITIGHELGHDALERMYKKGIMIKKTRNICEETFCDLCGLEYWSFKNRRALTDKIFKKILYDKVTYVKNTLFNLGAEKNKIAEAVKEDKLRFTRAWEWLQYAMWLEEEGKVAELDPSENIIDYELEKNIGIQELKDSWNKVLKS